MIISTALTIGAIATAFFAFPLALLLLVLAPGVLSVGLVHRESATRAKVVTLAPALILGLAVGALGLGANRCASEPLVVALFGGVSSTAVFIVATAIGAAAAGGGRVVLALVAAGITAVVGFGTVIVYVISKVFVLC